VGGDSELKQAAEASVMGEAGLLLSSLGVPASLSGMITRLMRFIGEP
jgi:hypothetical protein